MDKNSNVFTVLFATVICVVLAICLAATYNGLKSKMDANTEFDRQQNVLIAMGLYDKSAGDKPRAELEKLFHDRVVGEVLQVKRGTEKQTVKRAGKRVQEEVSKVMDVVKTDVPIADLEAQRKEENKKPPSERRELVSIYRAVDENGKTTAWCIPISGYGLWSTLYGFLAIDADLRTVKGITFYKQGETPGLGGEVENPEWQKKWVGKKFLDEAGHVVGIKVKKGVVDPKVENERLHMVDGLSGATLTSNGVTRFVLRDLQTYEPYFEKFRS